MRALHTGALLLGVALVSGCPDSGPPRHIANPPSTGSGTGTSGTKPATSTAGPTSRPTDGSGVAAVGTEAEPYKDVKVGQIYVMKIGAHVTAGGEVVSRREVRQVTDKYIVLNVTNRAPGMPRYNEQPMQDVIKYLDPPKRGTVPQPDAKKIKSETRTVSGVAFECDVYDEVDTNAGAQKTVWLSKRFPFRIRVEIEDGSCVEELLAIEEKK